MRYDISIVIPTHNRSKYLEGLLKSLLRQKLETSFFEVVVVSNLYSKPVEKLCSKYSQRGLNIKGLTRGYAGANAARNLGILNSSGKYILLLDDDCVIEDNDYLQRIINLHTKYDTYAGIGGLYAVNTKMSASQAAYNINANRWLLNGSQQGRVELIGGNASYKAQLFKNRVKFNENITYGGTETELNHRLRIEGHKLMLVSDLIVGHYPKMSLLNLTYKSYLQGVGKKRLLSSMQSEVDIDEFELTSTGHGNRFINAYLKVYNSFFDLGFNTKIKSGKPNRISFLSETLTLFKAYAKMGVFAYIVKFFSILSLPFNIINHYFRVHSWKLPNYLKYRLLPILTKPFIFCAHIIQLHRWRAPHFISHKLLPFLYGVLLPFIKFYHFIKLHYWKNPIFLMFHFFKRNIWRPFHFIYYELIFPVKWRFINLIKYKFVPLLFMLSYPMRATYHFMRLHLWKLTKVFHFLNLHVWKLKHTVLKPIHFWKENSWKVENFILYRLVIPSYYFLKNKILWPMSFPFRKIYYVFSYQYEKRLRPIKSKGT